MKVLIIVFFYDCFFFFVLLFEKERCYYFRLELAFIFRAFDVRARVQTEVYFRDIIFLQNVSELTISLLPEKKKLNSAYKLFKLAPDLIVSKVNMVDT